MSLVGTSVGHIRIVGDIGRGGMGEVYIGFDERLQRRVALKAIVDPGSDLVLCRFVLRKWQEIGVGEYAPSLPTRTVVQRTRSDPWCYHRRSFLAASFGAYAAPWPSLRRQPTTSIDTNALRARIRIPERLRPSRRRHVRERRTTWEDCADGANVLLSAVLEMDRS